ncbi:MAG: hypothetical protein BRC58_06160 [Cyanobacteria bacterium QS_8_64_29]|nr:MAG: hypothetical protein BRC58_06160 [Cyanobacteria bacterium QS_8_64_29]
MVAIRSKPFLVGGIGLSVVAWLGASWQGLLVPDGWSLLAPVALGAGAWWWRRHQAPSQPAAPQPERPGREQAERAIATAQATLSQLEAEAEAPQTAAAQQALERLSDELTRTQLRVAVTGGKRAGKTCLVQALADCHFPACPPLQWVETAPLLGDAASEAAAWERAIACDAVVFATDGDLSASAWVQLRQLRAAQLPVLLALTKRDRCAPEARAQLVQHLSQQGRELVAEGSIVTVAAAPEPIQIRRYRADGSLQQDWEQPAAEVVELRDRLAQLLGQQGQQLVWATVARSAQRLQSELKPQLDASRCARALPVVERYQWLAAATAFANPVAALDVMASAAISAQAIADLGAIYRQPFSASQAKVAAAEIGKLLVSLGLVELSTQAVGSLLKGHAATYAAGGLVQGVSAAYLMRLVGLSLIDYFQSQPIDCQARNPLDLEALGRQLQRTFRQTQRGSALSAFVRQTATYLLPRAITPQSE